MSRIRSTVSVVALLGAALAGGCDAPSQAPLEEQAAMPDAAATDPAVNASPPVSHTFTAAITAEDFSQHVQTLAADDFGGRGPGTDGERKTVDYLVEQFKRIGLKPGNGDSYTQSVPMISMTADPAATIAITTPKGTTTLNQGVEMVVGSRNGDSQVIVNGSPIIFVGYGVDAPEASWNDYAGMDFTGKTVVMLVNDPGFHAGDAELFNGKRMTYYGRWTYKFEEAARKGAAAAFVVHDDAGAGYGWDVVRNSWTGEQHDLPSSVDPAPRLPLEGWLTGDAARALFATQGLDYDAQVAAANRKGFTPVALDATLSASVKSTSHTGESSNVLAMLPGSEKPDEVVIYMAHWDHLGTADKAPEGHGEDRIYNGAIDNATGVAGILEIAEAFASQSPPPKRSILFIPVTLEESGLLGSKYYVANPVIPLEKTVAVVNLDAMSVVGQTSDVSVIGLGNSKLEDVLENLARAQNRTLIAESAPEKGFFYRSDHFNFAKAGVPALYAKSGATHRTRGAEFGESIAQDYITKRYHSPADEFDPNWDLAGVVEDIEVLYGVGKELSGNETWPNWREGNEFRGRRDEMMAAAAKAQPPP